MYQSSLRVGYGTGRTGEQISVWTDGTDTDGKIAVVLCHGFLGTAVQFYDADIPLLARGLAGAGIVALAPDLGLGDNGLNNWGHDDVVDPGGAIDDAFQWAHDNLGTRDDKGGIYGTSMGGTAAAWVWRNLDRFASGVFTIPCLATAALHAQNPIGLAPFMELAFAGEGGFEASLPTHDPSDPANLASLATVADRIGIWYSGNDNVINHVDVEAFAAATGCHLVNTGNVGHSLAPGSNQDILNWWVPKLIWV